MGQEFPELIERLNIVAEFGPKVLSGVAIPENSTRSELFKLYDQSAPEVALSPKGSPFYIDAARPLLEVSRERLNGTLVRKITGKKNLSLAGLYVDSNRGNSNKVINWERFNVHALVDPRVGSGITYFFPFPKKGY